MFDQELKVYVAKNTVPEKRTGEYLLLFRRGTRVLAFGLSTKDAVRAQKNGAGFLGEADAKDMIERIDDEQDHRVIVTCGTDYCPNRGGIINAVMVREDLLQAFLESFGHGGEDPADYCPQCGQLGVAHEE